MTAVLCPVGRRRRPLPLCSQPAAHARITRRSQHRRPHLHQRPHPHRHQHHRRRPVMVHCQSPVAMLHGARRASSSRAWCAPWWRRRVWRSWQVPRWRSRQRRTSPTTTTTTAVTTSMARTAWRTATRTTATPAPALPPPPPTSRPPFVRCRSLRSRLPPLRCMCASSYRRRCLSHRRPCRCLSLPMVVAAVAAGVVAEVVGVPPLSCHHLPLPLLRQLHT